MSFKSLNSDFFLMKSKGVIKSIFISIYERELSMSPSSHWNMMFIFNNFFSKHCLSYYTFNLLNVGFGQENFNKIFHVDVISLFNAMPFDY